MAWAFVSGRTEPSLRARAMRFLARREHSRLELRRKLAAIAGEGDDVDAVLEELATQGWLSDARFAEQSIRARSRRHGPLRLVHDLRAKGVGEETIAAAFHAAGEEGEADIEKVWRSRFKAPPAGERERARQVRFLQGRGFPLDAALKFIKGVKT